MNFNKVDDFKQSLIPYSNKMIEDAFDIIRKSPVLEHFNRGKEEWLESDVLSELYYQDLENTTEATGLPSPISSLVVLVNQYILKQSCYFDFDLKDDFIDSEDLSIIDLDAFNEFLTKINYKEGTDKWLDYIIKLNSSLFLAKN